jgi:sorbitol-specific phosphotransferase system component IIA
MMFDGYAPSGTLPVNVPALTVVNEETGTVAHSNEPFYTRGTGLQSFDYDFVAGMNESHEKGSATGLSFRANARHDKLTAVQVDGTALSETDCVVGAGSTTFELPAAYLDTLAEGDHTLAAVYDYGTGPFTLSTSFNITKQASPTPEPEVKKGSVHTVSGMAYTVTKVASAKAAGTVTLKTAKAAATVAVPASVKIGGKTYKVTAIGTKAFSKAAKKVVTVSVGANVATIGTSAFVGCAKLKTVKGGAGVTTIGAAAFSGCANMSSCAPLGSKKLKKIGKACFLCDSKLKTLYIKQTTKLTKKGVKNSLYLSSVKKVKVKKSKVKKYKKYFTYRNCAKRGVKVKK